jgi:hypothetical protein
MGSMDNNLCMDTNLYFENYYNHNLNMVNHCIQNMDNLKCCMGLMGHMDHMDRMQELE